MKIRTNFVSNSSSCSFIIHKSYLTKEQINQLESLYNKLDEEDKLYDDNNTKFIEQTNYIKFNCYGGFEYIEPLLKEFNITKDKIFSNYM